MFPCGDLVDLLYVLNFRGDSVRFPDGNLYYAIEVGGHTIYGIIHDPLDTSAHAHIHSDEWKIRFQIPNDWPRSMPLEQKYGRKNTYIFDIVFEGNQDAFIRDLTYFKMLSST